jgi:hypothetical protein
MEYVMPDSKAHEHAAVFLDSRLGGVISAEWVNELLDLLVNDRRAEAAFGEMTTWVTAQIKLLGVDPSSAKSSTDVLDLLAAVSIVNERGDGKRTVEGRTLTNAATALAKLEEDFVPSLLKEVRGRASRNAVYAHELSKARKRAVRSVSIASEAYQQWDATHPDRAGDGLPPVVRASVAIPIILLAIAFAGLAYRIWVAPDAPKPD